MTIIDILAKIVGPDRVSNSDIICQSYQRKFKDSFGKERVNKPDIIAMAETTEQVSEILKVANQYKIPVAPRSGTIGSGVGNLHGGILLDLTLMNRILKIDVNNMKAIAESGCTFYTLLQELFKNGLMLPMPGATSGMSVAASALNATQGIGQTRYGSNIDLVEGFEVVLPSGEIIRIGSLAYADSDFGPYYRYITGPDLIGLFLKSNGAFGIVTKVAYHCAHRPKHWSFHSYYWPMERIEDATRVLVESTAAEIFDVHFNDKWRWVRYGEPTVFPEDCYFIINFAVNGENELELKGKEQTIENICQAHRGTCLPGLAKDFYTHWAHPDNYMETLSVDRQKPRWQESERSAFGDLMYPITWLPEIYAKTTELFKKYGPFHPEHRGMTDVYPMKHQVISGQQFVSLDYKDPYWLEQLDKCRDEFREWFGKRGGTYQFSLPPLVPQYAWTNQMGAYNLLKSIKGFLDPNNILSPGTFGSED